MLYVSQVGDLDEYPYICLQTAAHFGAYVIGSDIDGRQMRGKGACSRPFTVCEFINQTGASPGVYRCAEQYGLSKRVLDCCTFDITKNPWRLGGIFDAIVTDPPCESQTFHEG